MTRPATLEVSQSWAAERRAGDVALKSSNILIHTTLLGLLQLLNIPAHQMANRDGIKPSVAHRVRVYVE